MIALTVDAPQSVLLKRDMLTYLRSVLSRAEIEHQIFQQGPKVRIEMPSPLDSEVRFLTRLLQRAGYDVLIEESD